MFQNPTSFQQRFLAPKPTRLPVVVLTIINKPLNPTNVIAKPLQKLVLNLPLQIAKVDIV
jgi:hypothetical protein